MLPAANQDDPEPLPQLVELLRSIARGLAPDRSEAVLYSSCRSALLTSRYRELIPGFLIQCISVFKFRDFIGLYDPSPQMRERFLELSFGRCQALYDQEHGLDRIERAQPSRLRWEL